MKAVPKEIKALDGMITIGWSDGHAARYAARDVRLACRCAACVDEWTHERLIAPDRVPPDVKAAGIEVVGNYALHFSWSDGHDTGIYTYDYLRGLCGCEQCRQQRSFSV